MNTRQHSPLLVTILTLTLFAFSAAPVLAQDNGPPTETPSEAATLTSLPTLTPSATETPLPTETATLFLTETATMLPTETPTEVTATEMPTDSTLALSETPTETSTLEGATLLSATPSVSETPTITETPTLEASVTATVTETPTETPTLVIPMATFHGIAAYQNRQPDNAGIRVRIFSGSEALLNETATDAAGMYQVDAPAQEFFWLVVDAPLHRPFRVGVWPGETMPMVVLAGGDLNGDGCVGRSDLALLTAQFEQPASTAADITGDGIAEGADLALLAGNYDAACGASPATATPTTELLTVTSTPEPTPSLEASPPIEPSLTPSEEAPLPPAETLAAPTAEATLTATLETVEGG